MLSVLGPLWTEQGRHSFVIVKDVCGVSARVLVQKGFGLSPRILQFLSGQRLHVRH